MRVVSAFARSDTCVCVVDFDVIVMFVGFFRMEFILVLMLLIKEVKIGGIVEFVDHGCFVFLSPFEQEGGFSPHDHSFVDVGVVMVVARSLWKDTMLMSGWIWKLDIFCLCLLFVRK